MLLSGEAFLNCISGVKERFSNQTKPNKRLNTKIFFVWTDCEYSLFISICRLLLLTHSGRRLWTFSRMNDEYFLTLFNNSFNYRCFNYFFSMFPNTSAADLNGIVKEWFIQCILTMYNIVCKNRPKTTWNKQIQSI